jgi:hypothetical protein
MRCLSKRGFLENGLNGFMQSVEGGKVSINVNNEQENILGNIKT